MAGWKNWAALETVTEPDFQGYLQDQVVMRFASAAARDAALGANATKGMLSYRIDGSILEEYTGSSWVAAAGVPYGAVGGLNKTTSGTNNADITPTITVPAAAYARVALVGLQATFTVTGTGTAPRLRIVKDGAPQTPYVPFNTTVPTAQVNTIYLIGAGMGATFKGNVDVPAGFTVISYDYETKLHVVVTRAGAAL